MRVGFLTRAWRRLRIDTRGVAAVEFALVVPAVILVYAVGFEVTEAGTVYRKLTDTTVQLANVTSQYTSMSTTDVGNVLDASVQIMTPYPTSNITAVLTEVKVNANKKGVVQWSCGYPSGTSPLATSSKVTMPTGFQTSGSYFILVQTTYSYQPTIGSAFMHQPIAMTNQIFMLPRASSSITGPSTCP